MKIRIQVSKEYQLFEVEEELNPGQNQEELSRFLREFANKELDALLAAQKGHATTQYKTQTNTQQTTYKHAGAWSPSAKQVSWISSLGATQQEIDSATSKVSFDQLVNKYKN